MSAFDYNELKRHVGHQIECVTYADGINVAIECLDCNEVLMDYDKPESNELTTPKQKCMECGHISDQFIQPAKVNCDALVDYKGEFQWWKSENFENPEFEKGTFMCEECYSEDLEDYKEVLE